MRNLYGFDSFRLYDTCQVRILALASLRNGAYRLQSVSLGSAVRSG
jgi:hypothetical protein